MLEPEFLAAGLDVVHLHRDGTTATVPAIPVLF
jgi:hypothetical protein